jgi:hypothetical protein
MAIGLRPFVLVSQLVLLAMSPAACQPQAVGKDAAQFGGSDGGRTDSLPRDGALARDSARRDRPQIDGQLHLDGSVRDSMLGPRTDAGGIRDVAGMDLTIGPRRDAAGTDQAAPPPGTQPCQQWQDCAPHYGDAYSGYQCIGNLCTCDPDSSMMTQCTVNGGQWLGPECFCVTNATPMPRADAGSAECWWSWHQDDCEPDRWVDTSYYEYIECYDEDGEYYYDCGYWVYDGYYEDGYCPDGYWIEVCP